MFYGKIKPLPLITRVLLFLGSYSGLALIAGTLCLTWSIIYKVWLCNIEAPYDWFPPIGEVFFSVALSVVASVIFYYVTSFFPSLRKKAIVDKLILRWLQQLNWYGEMILGDVAHVEYNVAIKMAKEEWEDSWHHKLSEQPKLGSFYLFGPSYNNWFEYFEQRFEEEDYYIHKCLQYQDYLPIEIMSVFEDIEIHGNLRQALAQYKREQITNEANRALGKETIDFDDMQNLARLIWMHCENLRSLIETYQRNAVM